MGVLALPLGLSRAGLCRVSHILGLVVDSSSGNIAAEHCDPFHAEAKNDTIKKNLGSYFILSKHLHVNLINSSKTYLPLSSIFGSLLSTVYFQSCSDSIDSISYLHCESAR